MKSESKPKPERKPADGGQARKPRSAARPSSAEKPVRNIQVSRDDAASDSDWPAQGADRNVSSGLNGKTKQIVEAILFAANRSMTIKQIQQVFPELEQPDSKEIQQALDAIETDYKARPIGLKRTASGYRFQIRARMSPWVARLFTEKPPKYSRALLETLAIIAYRQPVTRGEIEEIRGVSVSSNIIRTLLEREWVRVIAHKEVPGRPALYGTTRQFLDYFNLSSLSDLPDLTDIENPALHDDILTATESDHSETKETTAEAEIAEPGQQEGKTAASETSAFDNSTLH